MALESQRPPIVCLCGSTRFWRTFQEAGLKETLAGRIVLSIGAAAGTDDEHFGNLSRDEYERVKAELDELHLRKIDLADEVLILDVNSYIGESTQRELEYAIRQGKRIRFWEQEQGLEVRMCRACGCTDDDCSGCIARTGWPCSWVEPDLCSACAEDAA
jgi:hypothetical protein